MKLNKLLLTILILSSIVSFSQENSLNFMLGDWDIDAKIRQNEINYLHGKGTMNVYFNESKDTLFADMDIKFQNFNVVGTTKRTYNKKIERWDVSWNPSIDGRQFYPNIEGKFNEGNFIEIDYGKDFYGSFIGKLVIYDISDKHFSVRKDNIYDDGTFMKDIWVYEATKK